MKIVLGFIFLLAFVARAAEDDYEVDYEEEVAPVEKKEPHHHPNAKKGMSASSDTTMQGSRAKKQLTTPAAKSENKSVYQKNGAPLDVDTD